VETIVIQLSRLLWKKTWQVDVFGQNFGLALRIVDDEGAGYVELEAESHRARVKLVESVAAVMMIRDVVQLKLGISDIEWNNDNLKRASLDVHGSAGNLNSRLLVREIIEFGLLDDQVVPQTASVREI
jgi:hypothetical protein